MLNSTIFELKKDLPLANSGVLVQIKNITNTKNYNIYTLGSSKGKNRRKLLTTIPLDKLSEWIKIANFPKQKEDEKNFYFVSVEGESAPKYKHYSLSEAKKESQRLAKLTGRKTYILLALKKYEYENSEIYETSYKTKI